MKIALMLRFDQDSLQDVSAFMGPLAEEKAKAAFLDYTGVTYDDYTKRRIEGPEDDIDILGEDHAGSTILIVEAEN
ncbi:hypothetical protein [Paenibacillus sp. 1P03SA]|uniref:hypothetical protein n=1 Tax=Paenibacillus sp. 1P03SA TaxID=3132294 RepID=UPI00399F3829